MAILTGINTRLSGSAGDWTFQQNGKTIAKQKVQPKQTPTRTYEQMRQRMQWGNLVNLYGSFEGTLHPSFEGRARGMSDFNMFMRYNLGREPVYLTKEAVRQGGCVVAGYVVTRGSLPAIDVSLGNDGTATTDIDLGDLTLSGTTTLKAFSDAVVEHNPGYAYGDQLSCFRAYQTVNSATGVPYVKIEAMEVTLNGAESERLLHDVASSTGFATVDGMLGASGVTDGAIVWVHSRKSGGRTVVSSQAFVAANSVAARFQGASALAEAILSYGGTVSPQFLTPNVDETMAPANP